MHNSEYDPSRNANKMADMTSLVKLTHPLRAGKLENSADPDEIFLFGCGLMLYVPDNSHGHVGTVSSPNYTFSWSVYQYFVHILSLVTDNNPS